MAKKSDTASKTLDFRISISRDPDSKLIFENLKLCSVKFLMIEKIIVKKALLEFR